MDFAWPSFYCTFLPGDDRYGQMLVAVMLLGMKPCLNGFMYPTLLKGVTLAATESPQPDLVLILSSPGARCVSDLSLVV